jgi:GNAT superfamily N-acetyltransferase
LRSPIAIQPRIEKLAAGHDLTGFDCGADGLNRFLKQFALVNQKAGSSQTYLALVGSEVVGYYSLTAGNVLYDDAPKRLTKGLPRHPVPVILLARLAIHKDWQRQRLGQGLLLDALRRTLQAADIAGVRALLVRAKDDTAKAFYEHFGFEPYTTESPTLYRLLKDVRSMLEG